MFTIVNPSCPFYLLHTAVRACRPATVLKRCSQGVHPPLSLTLPANSICNSKLPFSSLNIFSFSFLPLQHGAFLLWMPSKQKKRHSLKMQASTSLLFLACECHYNCPSPFYFLEVASNFMQSWLSDFCFFFPDENISFAWDVTHVGEVDYKTTRRSMLLRLESLSHWSKAVVIVLPSPSICTSSCKSLTTNLPLPCN